MMTFIQFSIIEITKKIGCFLIFSGIILIFNNNNKKQFLFETPVIFWKKNIFTSMFKTILQKYRIKQTFIFYSNPYKVNPEKLVFQVISKLSL